MSPQWSPVTALSAPGKVLLTGGYLVLDRNYTGTVFALDARIHVVVQQMRKGPRRGTTSGEVQSGASIGAFQEAEDVVIVRSPQFVNAVWEYGIQRCDNEGGVKMVQKGDGCDSESFASLPPVANEKSIDPGIPSLRPR